MMLEFNIRNQEISRIDSFSPAEKSVGYLVAKFNFKTDDWNGASKIAVFKNLKTKEEYDKILEEDACIVPSEALSEKGQFEVSVYGLKDGQKITSNVATCNLNRTLLGGSMIEDDSLNAAEKLLLEVQNKLDKSGHAPNKFLGTDEKGNVVTKEQEKFSLEVAGEEKLGGVKPLNKTDDMTLEVGVDKDGRLFAKGRATGYVFDTLADLELALKDVEFTSTLVLGDNLYIRATDVPDYWWDGEQKQQLETQKVDLVNYVTKDDINELKSDISNLRFGDPYDGVDLVAKFAEEISGYTDPGAWIRSRIRANNFDGIHVNDYIPFATTNGLNFKARVAGIDPYYEYGDSAVGHHIDFVCEELWPTLHPINPVNYNNGLIPTENVTSDGSSAQYVLTKPMYGVAKVTLSGTDLTGWTYDKDTYTLTFSTAPAAGTMVVTGTGSEYPWLSCDAYLYANSLAGHVPNGTGVNPAIKRVDYTNDGIYHYLPDWLKAVIIEKRFMLNKRYSASGVLSDENSWGSANLGKLWFPTEVEVYGCPVWGSKGGYGLGGSIQYPLFMGNMRRLKKRNGGRYDWWLLPPDNSKTGWCYVSNHGNAASYSASYVWIAVPVCFRIG